MHKELLSKLDDYIEQLIASNVQLHTDNQITKLQPRQLTTMINYLDRATVYSGVGLPKGQKKAVSFYAPFYSHITNIDNWTICSSTDINAMTTINVAYCGMANMFAVFVNDFVITMNMCTEFIDPKPKTETSKSTQFSWKFPTNASTSMILESLQYVPQAADMASYDDDQLTDEDREMEAHLARMREEEAQDLRKRTNAAYGISNGNPDDFI